MCSCYVPSRNSYEGEEGHCKIGDNNNVNGKLLTQGNSNGGSTNNRSSIDQPPTVLKSNLKKASTSTVVEEVNQTRTGTRKVSWPDAHGKAIAHVQEFEPR